MTARTVSHGVTDEHRRMAAFHALTRAEQAEALRMLLAQGMSEYDAARASGLSVEFIRRVVGMSMGA